MTDLKEKLGLRIKELRKNSNISQEKLAELINMDVSNLSNIERGKRFMTAKTIEKITTALKVTERDLFDFSNQYPQQYYNSDILKLLAVSSENDIKFFLDVMKSYFKYK